MDADTTGGSVGFDGLFQALGQNLPAAIIAVLLLALGWIVREHFKLIREHAAELKGMNEKHLTTALQVVPLASKLAECVVILERLTTSRMGGGA